MFLVNILLLIISYVDQADMNEINTNQWRLVHKRLIVSTRYLSCDKSKLRQNIGKGYNVYSTEAIEYNFL